MNEEATLVRVTNDLLQPYRDENGAQIYEVVAHSGRPGAPPIGTRGTRAYLCASWRCRYWLRPEEVSIASTGDRRLVTIGPDRRLDRDYPATAIDEPPEDPR